MTTPPEGPEPSGAGPGPGPAPEPARPTFEERAEAFGKKAEESAEAFGRRAEALGKEAEAAAQRWSSSPAVKESADAASRVWGLVLLAVGVWFFADVTLGMDMPSVAWRDLWPVLLIVFGGFIVLRGMQRRS